MVTVIKVDTRIADWRTASGEGSAGRVPARKVGDTEPTAPVTNWWDPLNVENLLKLGAITTAVAQPGLGLLAAIPYYLRGEADRNALIDEAREEGSLLEDRSEEFGPEGNVDVAQAFAIVTDIRDAILLNAAEGLLDSTGKRNPTRVRVARRAAERLALFEDPAGGDSGGGGGGRGGPVYVAPDRRIVEEFVGDKMIVLTGRRQPELQAVVDAYMRDHRRQWEGKSVDPQATVLEQIRNSKEYKRIHELRAESADENTWVNQRQDRLTQLGLTSAAAEARGIELAAVGTNLNDIDIGKFQIGRGRKDITLMRRLEEVAGQIGSVI